MSIAVFSEKQQMILQLLVQEKGGMTVDQFAQPLKISRSAIHQHMTVLERDGYLARSATIQTGGRPGTAYVLTDKGVHLFPKHYSLFADMLIKLIRQKIGSEGLVEYLHELGVSLSETKKDALKNKSLREQIEMTVLIMQELGYEARLESGKPDELPMIDAYNCIFHNLAYKNDEVCELDMSLLSSLLDSKIQRVCCMATGGKRCRFKILPSDNVKAVK